MAMLCMSENCKQCMRLQKAVSSIAWLARVKQDAQCTKNLSKKKFNGRMLVFCQGILVSRALTEHTGEIFFSILAALINPVGGFRFAW